jgi:hypothetical protein
VAATGCQLLDVQSQELDILNPKASMQERKKAYENLLKLMNESVGGDGTAQSVEGVNSNFFKK